MFYNSTKYFKIISQSNCSKTNYMLFEHTE